MKIRVTKQSDPKGDGVVFDFHDIHDKPTAVAMAKKRINNAKTHKFNIAS